MDRDRICLHHDHWPPDRTDQPHPHLPCSPPHAELRTIRFHDLRHTTATLLLEEGVELVVIKELLGHAHIGVTATIYAHVRLGLQRQALDTLSATLDRS
ncbi:tyrosine-type recombinase/integrase [Streptomyces drozdowiczii]|uniref:Tyrosine-type recombinase/integrase n=1 Tax=Streptomyces drozdowiczii TaxID=202862 RepID=A0ABY6PLB9_9ACTN|nr:tyrosine-type recombinase/integrase [Streptomyces drozdowiczii]UZK52784.1 tyrosine-type recombinase/integrase [Streptomyces drozdowiczii]